MSKGKIVLAILAGANCAVMNILILVGAIILIEGDFFCGLGIVASSYFICSKCGRYFENFMYSLHEEKCLT